MLMWWPWQGCSVHVYCRHVHSDVDARLSSAVWTTHAAVKCELRMTSRRLYCCTAEYE